jgi:2,4-dienoyl-CoA reductase (NADPH2)
LRLAGEAGTEELAADTVVLATGTRSENGLRELLAERGIPCRTCGDAEEPGLVLDAVRQGFVAGREVA